MIPDDSVKAWLDCAGRWPLLTAEQEVTLGRLVQAWMVDPNPSRIAARRGQRARDRFVSCNLRLVAAVERRCVRGGDLVDRLQIGTIGLIRAVEKFDPARGYRFSTYAYWWIRKEIVRSVVTLPTASGIRVPGTWALDDPRRDEFSRAVSLDAQARSHGRDNPGGTVAEVIAGATLTTADLAQAEAVAAAVAAMVEVDTDATALLQLRAEGWPVEDLGPLVNRVSATSALGRARARLRVLPEVEMALVG